MHFINSVYKERSMNLFQRYLAEEFAEDYEEGRLSRRDALKLIASVTGSLIAANSILAACTPAEEAGVTPSADAPAVASTIQPAATMDPATPIAQPLYGTVMPDDPAVIASEIQFPAADGASLIGYMAQPSSGELAPVILVCHENR